MNRASVPGRKDDAQWDGAVLVLDVEVVLLGLISDDVPVEVVALLVPVLLVAEPVASVLEVVVP